MGGNGTVKLSQAMPIAELLTTFSKTLKVSPGGNIFAAASVSSRNTKYALEVPVIKVAASLVSRMRGEAEGPIIVQFRDGFDPPAAPRYATREAVM
jgi:hypothetical protein